MYFSWFVVSDYKSFAFWRIHVARMPDGFDDSGESIDGFELAPQPADVHVHAAVEGM
jgi:hypothetical protein